jgi:hypothetical protein
MTLGASAINFIGLNMEKSWTIYPRKCVLDSFFPQKHMFFGKTCIFLKKKRYFWKKQTFFWKHNCFYWEKHVFGQIVWYWGVSLV